jgi:hypothetical protein
VAPETRDDDDFDDSDLVSEVRGPGDSHYEWQGIEGPDPDDSQVELPAFTDEEESASGEAPVYADSASEEMSVIDFGDDLGTKSHARFRHAATLFLRAGLLATVCFFVYEAGRISHSAGSSLMAFAAVGLGLVSLLLLDHELRGLLLRLVALPPRKPGLRGRAQGQTAR